MSSSDSSIRDSLTSYSSGSTYTGRGYSSRGSRTFKLLDSESRYTFIVSTVLALISAATIAIGANQFFGPIGSAGFNISIGGGSLLGLISLGSIVYQVRKQCKKKASKLDYSDVNRTASRSDYSEGSSRGSYRFESRRERDTSPPLPEDSPLTTPDHSPHGSKKPPVDSRNSESPILEDD